MLPFRDPLCKLCDKKGADAGTGKDSDGKAGEGEKRQSPDLHQLGDDPGRPVRHGRTDHPGILLHPGGDL